MSQRNQLLVTITVFARYLHGKLKDKVNPNSSAQVSLYTQRDPETGQWESVTNCLDRFRKQTDEAVFKISSVVEVGA